MSPVVVEPRTQGDRSKHEARYSFDFRLQASLQCTVPLLSAS